MVDVSIPFHPPVERQLELPPLWLHPLHTATNSSTPAPLRPHESETQASGMKLLIDVAKDAVQKHPSVLSSSIRQQLSAHHISLPTGGRGFLVHPLDACEQVPWQILLRFSEVAHFLDSAPFLVVGLHDKVDEQIVECMCPPWGALWIIGVGAGEAFEYPQIVLQRLLSAVSVFGAIRSDLHVAYELSENPVGNCSLSEVFRAQVRGTARLNQINENPNELVAVKAFSQSDRAAAGRKAMAEAAWLLATAQHPNVACFYGLFRFPDPADDSLECWATMTEYCSAGDLHRDVALRGPCCEWRSADIMIGLLSALSHLHARRIVHRDVKSETIHLKDQGQPVLFDFGSAARLDDAEAMRRRCGSPGYCAPEILTSQEYGIKVDVFSAGVVLYFVLSGQLPFSGPCLASILRRNARCHVNMHSKRLSQVSLCMKTFIMRMLYKEVLVRPDSANALEQMQRAYSALLSVHAEHAWKARRLDMTVGDTHVAFNSLSLEGQRLQSHSRLSSWSPMQERMTWPARQERSWQNETGFESD